MNLEVIEKFQEVVKCLSRKARETQVEWNLVIV